MTMYTAGDNKRDPGHTTPQSQIDSEKDDWLDIARSAFETSDSWFDASVRKSIERNIAHFNNTHAPGSKYFSDAYKFRARGFRPKTRSVLRKRDASAAKALFSTSDVVTVSAENDGDEAQVLSAEICQELLQYRLENTVPWYKIAIGAFQDANVAGVCISHQCWDYTEITDREPAMDDQGGYVMDEMGEPVYNERYTRVKDTPRIELRPVENIRFSPSADWDDPLGTSPYIIDQMPMEIGEVKERGVADLKNPVPWFEVDDAALQQGLTTDYDSLRSQRSKGRQDANDVQHSFTDFDTVWVHRNIIHKNGRDWVYYTLGVHFRLSDPVPLEVEYPWLAPGERPYVLGVSNIESHKNYPESLSGLSAPLQQEANDINNQRRDNVMLVLNRRYFAKRGSSIDFRSLSRNVPGSVTLMDDLADVKSETMPEVTGSSYQEQDRVNMDFDEIAGSFSNSSVGSNRQLNETVGGMELLSGNSDELTEFDLRTWVTTWVEPVLKQVIKLEQYYESDEAILSVVSNKVGLWQRYGMDRITDRLLMGSMTVEVDVGFGSTNPNQRIQRIVNGMGAVFNIVPEMRGRMGEKGAEAVVKEIFGAMGFRSTERFFPPADPNNPPQPQVDPRMELEKFKAEAAQQREQMKAELEQMKIESKMQSEDQERKLKYVLAQMERDGDVMELAGKRELSIENIKAKLGESAMKERGQNERFLAEREFAVGPGNGRGL